jgi:hypothetical protein
MGCPKAGAGGEGTGVGLASDKRNFPQVSAKHANQEKMSAERSESDGASGGDCT